MPGSNRVFRTRSLIFQTPARVFRPHAAVFQAKFPIVTPEKRAPNIENIKNDLKIGFRRGKKALNKLYRVLWD
jgi:hypothetical protein